MQGNTWLSETLQTILMEEKADKKQYCTIISGWNVPIQLSHNLKYQPEHRKQCFNDYIANPDIVSSEVSQPYFYTGYKRTV